MILKAIKSISVGVLIQVGLGLAIQGLAQADLGSHQQNQREACLSQGYCQHLR